MLAMLGLAFWAVTAIGQDAQCKPGVVLEVAHGRDYTLNICGTGVVGLRGVEAPLRTATSMRPVIGGPERAL
jgi:hypothetical protein